MSISPQPGDKKCVEGTEYVWVKRGGPAGNDLTSINDKLSQIIDILLAMSGAGGGGGVGGCGPCNGEYASITRTVQAKKTDEEIIIGIKFRNIQIRTDQTITVKLGGTMGDEIDIDATESPFEIYHIGGTGYDTIYVTTNASDTILRILAYN